MVKKFQVNLAKFTHGQIDNTFNFYNFNGNYYETANKIQNFILNNNALQRRPPLQCIKVIQGNSNCFIYGINNNSNTMLALVIHSLNANNIESNQQVEFYNHKNLLGCQYPNKFTHSFSNAQANLNHYSVYNNTLYLFSNYYSYQINLNNFLKTPPADFNLIDGPYIDNTDTSTTFYANNTINLEGKTMQIVTTNKQLDNKNLYKDNHRFIKILNSGVWVSMKYYANSNQLNLIVEMLNTFVDTSVSNTYKLGISHTKRWHMFAFYLNRLYIAYNNNYIGVSVQNNLNTFSSTTRIQNAEGKPSNQVYANNGFYFCIPQGGNITWLNACNTGVLVGMQQGLYLVLSFKAEENISPLNYKVNKLFNTNCGTAFCNDFSGTVFADITGTLLYKVEVSSSADAKLQQLNAYCTSLFNSGIKKMVSSNYPHNTLWILLNNGTLVTATLSNTNPQTYSFATHSINLQQCVIQDIAYAYNNNYSYMYFIVQRIINNKPVVTLEYMDLLNNNAVFLDLMHKYSVTNNVITNLYSYNNTNVTVVVNGINLGVYKVVNNQVTLSSSAGVFNNVVACVGYAYSSVYTTPKIDYSEGFTDTQSSKQIVSATVTLSCGNGFVVQNANCNQHLTTVTVNNHNQPKSFVLNTAWHTQPCISFVQNNHLNLGITSIKLNLLSN